MKSDFNGDEILYDFYNPGIKDFMKDIVENKEGLEKYLVKYDDFNIITNLLNNKHISNEAMIESIVMSNYIDQIIRYPRSKSEFIYHNFKADIISQSIADGEINYNYRKYFSEEEKQSIHREIPIIKKYM